MVATSYGSGRSDGRVNVATNVVADHKRVFASGLRKNEVSGFDFVLRTYHALSGSLLWEKDLGRAPVPARSRRFQLPSTPVPLCTVGNTLITVGATAAVIFTMSGRDEDFQEVAIRLGARRGFGKPVRVEELIGAIREAFTR